MVDLLCERDRRVYNNYFGMYQSIVFCMPGKAYGVLKGHEFEIEDSLHVKEVKLKALRDAKALLNTVGCQSGSGCRDTRPLWLIKKEEAEGC